jgi:hypothetical protein
VKSNRKVKNGIQVTVYFPEDLDEKTKDWLNRCNNKSYEISEVIIKMANGELINRQDAQKEINLLTDSNAFFKEMLAKMVTIPSTPASNYANNKTIEQHQIQVVEKITTDNQMIPVATKETSASKNEGYERMVDSQDVFNKDNNNTQPSSTELASNSIAEGNTSNNSAIGNYKSRQFVKKGKSLSDLSI